MIPERFAPITYALFRIVFGLLFAFHGAQKILGWFGGISGSAVPVASMFGVAGVVELVCGMLILLGLFTRPAAFLASGQMAVAYFMVHQPQAAWPIQNQGEPAALFCFAFLYVASRGAGAWSIDGMMRPSRVRA